ncbi:hypothetical protein HMPREF0262_03604 [Clostridium sp. ATCC 29733]|nr:hypothetical protein HMPREF0262_03604 [Clostridium sp. ATCC 29733]
MGTEKTACSGGCKRPFLKEELYETKDERISSVVRFSLCL